MKSKYIIAIFIALVYAAMLMTASRSSLVSASPNAQATATDEPTKRPYAFPTPIFIPTYADDLPTLRATPGSANPPLQPGTDTFTVQSGDSLWIISQKVYGDGSKYKAIMEANGMTDQTKLRVGAVLKIPSLPGVVAQATPTAISIPVQVETKATPTPLLTQLANPAPQLTITSTPTLTPTPVPVVSGDTIRLGINLLSGILFLAGIAIGGLGYLRYARLRRIDRHSKKKQPIRVRQ